MEEADLELFLKTLVPYLDDPSEEAMWKKSDEGATWNSKTSKLETAFENT